VIDKLDLRIPAETPFSPEFGELYSHLRSADRSPLRSGKHYVVVGDLRCLGHEAILHMYCKHGKCPNHKLELVDTGKRGFNLLLDEIETVFEVDVWELEVMRVDFAIDVKEIPVSYFQQFVRAAQKQVVNDIENAELFTRMGRGEVQTIYLGKRPNCFRIYNKIAELKKQYLALLRKADHPGNLPAFEQVFGYPSEGLIVTRVERQYGGNRIPENIATVRDLWRNASSIYPFAPLQFSASGKPFLNPDNYGLTTYLKGIGLRELVKEFGLHRVRRFLNVQSKGNASRILREHADFLPSATIDMPDLHELFAESITRQCYSAATEPEFRDHNVNVRR